MKGEMTTPETAASAGSVGFAVVDVEKDFGDKCAEDEAEEHDGVP